MAHPGTEEKKNTKESKEPAKAVGIAEHAYILTASLDDDISQMK
jgi:hypothetical protein